MKYCSTCGRGHAQHEQYCAIDGTVLDKQVRPIRFEQATQFCVGCGHQMNGSSSYCPKCGHSRLVAATSEGSIVDRLPGMNDIRKKLKTQDWGSNIPWKEKGRDFLSRFDTSLANPSLAIGSVTALVFFAALAVLLFIILGVIGETALDGIKEIQQNIESGSDFSTIGLFFFLAFVSLAGIQLSSSEELKSRFITEVTRGDTTYLAEVQKAVNELDFHIFSGHLLLSLPGLLLLIASSWLLERGGIVGVKAVSWNERIERAFVFALTLTLLALLVGIFATDFGMFDLHLLKGIVRTFLLSFGGVLLFLFIMQKDLQGSWQVSRIALTTLMSVYLIGVLVTSVGQIVYLDKMEELDATTPGNPASLILFSGASPVYAMSQAGQVDFKLTALTQEYRLGAALYGEDRLNDLEKPLEEAGQAANLGGVIGSIGTQIQSGENPTLGPKVTGLDETVDIGLLSRVVQLASNPSAFTEEQLLRTSVAPYGLLVLLVMFAIHLGIGFRWIRTLPAVVIYAGVFMVGGLVLAYFTQTRLEIEWGDDILFGVAVSALTFWNACMLFLFPFLGGLVGYGIKHLKEKQQ